MAKSLKTTLVIIVIACCFSPTTAWRRRRRSCRRNCQWGSWGSYGSCSATCGTGVQRRYRGYSVHAQCGGAQCSGPSVNTRYCNRQCCPVACSWASWGGWGSCPRSCGRGIKSRTRSYARRASCGGASCSGASREEMACNTQCCPVACSWDSWGSWGSCSRSCGRGIKLRTRSYARRASCGGASCSGPSREEITCNTHCCPVNCRWDSWGSYGSCSATCGGGMQTRRRSVDVPSTCGGNGCSGNTVESRTCNTHCCAINCTWGVWGSYGSCSAKCGGGTQTRRRRVDVPSSCGGTECYGSEHETTFCNTQCCSVDCRWGSWETYDSCSVSCGGGMQTTHREVVVEPQCNGAPCFGSTTKSRACNTHCCPVDCRWGAWSEFTSCSSPCGGGQMRRTRRVVVHLDCGGSDCAGTHQDIETCNVNHCPIDCAWSEWDEWRKCSVTCGGGSQLRRRTIQVPEQYGGRTCSGMNTQTRNCNDVCCPVDCVWNNWRSWDACSKTCEKGVQTRKRKVLTQPLCGGALCVGNFTEERLCNDICCPVDCLYSEWSDWQSCSKTCGRGSKTRSRVIAIKASCDGNVCTGPTMETLSCNTQPCPVNCEMTSWGRWSVCSTSCGPKGTATRTRSIRIFPQFNGENCSEERQQYQACNRMCFNGELSVRSDDNNQSICKCDDGWSGVCCDQDIDECGEVEASTKPCHEYAFCSNTLGSYSCACLPGFEGDGHYECEDIDECSDVDNSTKLCHEDAFCSNAIGSYNCTCSSGFVGNGYKECEDIDECVMSHHECDVNAICNNEVGSYTCRCNPGYTGNGTNCINFNECQLEVDMCHSFADCVDVEGNYTCFCRTGFTGNGYECTDIDECGEVEASTKPCHEDAFCSNTLGSYSCACLPGFEGDGQYECEDIDECSDLESSTKLCHEDAFCSNAIGSYNCNCSSGFVGNGYKECEDIDECMMSLHDCDVNAICSNEIGWFSCQCNLGYTGNGSYCINFNECSLEVDKCHHLADCIDDEGNYTCLCKHGYTGNGFECTDINECSESESSTKPCHENAVCLNAIGSYDCTCLSGFEGDGYECEDINECSDEAESFTKHCHKDALCSNEVGSYKCTCLSGYVGDGFKQCEDADECIRDNQCDIHANCVNTLGGYHCQCHDGFVTDKERKCSDVDECALAGISSELCDDNAVCSNTIGGYNCTCKPGYVGDGNNKCEDANECTTKNTCGPNFQCINIPGSYKCKCSDGYTKDNLGNCADTDECKDGKHNCTGRYMTCKNLLGNFQCVCEELLELKDGTCAERTPIIAEDPTKRVSTNSEFDTSILFCILGGSLALVFIAIISIFVYKRKRRSHTITNTGWISHNLAFTPDLTSESPSNAVANDIKDEDL